MSVSRLRLTVGVAAVVATLPYLALKGLWITGATVGMTDPAAFRNPTYFVANLLTFLLDGVAVGVALALTCPWGRRLPAWLVLFPMWMATGLLGTILVALPVTAPLVGDTPAGGAEPDALESWVYVLVYGGFAAQGLLLLTAFVLYARQRWPQVFRSRCGELTCGLAGPAQAVLAVAGAAIAALVGAVHLTWSLGATAGLAGLSERQTAVDRALLGVEGAFAIAAATGLLMLVNGRPRRARVWLPLTLAWAGSGSMLAWGLYFLAIAAAKPQLSTPALSVTTGAKVVAALLVAVVVLRLPGRFELSRGELAHSSPRTR